MFFYHNITKGILNHTNEELFMVEYQEGDLVYITLQGNATLQRVTQNRLKEWTNKYNQ